MGRFDSLMVQKNRVANGNTPQTCLVCDERKISMSSYIAPKEKETRLHLRTSHSQKALLERAAKTRHLNLTQFVLQVCLEEAEKIVREQENENVIRVSPQHYDWLLQKLEEPPQDNPALRRLFAESPKWND
ncbi:hypothetical protein IAD21_01054 [Abditibacteriota bacterium]|nr:hypothetical protein IAD21_01054 [Abditibacteriota bacterium]